ncbi:carboxypeptidase-like regulatory domain-containing protein [Streptomyces sp. Li-HN-5-11]|uniref:MSCRAMM family protein n=1 Tax=Streptomyces sp. Li-HN-5-11 TaxID=3075432 RepID=UPI0028ADAA5A|nr:carboxypeptidase-like regulatory domain-containing protein [Streptomyces sp. Li-HN-5-11]WNM36569.1 carboxypeptidase-like regulatory domain-containing protein [Streptomyces sp. Li-HN-5-11]
MGARNAGTLRGLLRDHAGDPLARATLTLVDRHGRQKYLTRSHEDGTYTLPEPEPGAYLLVVSAEGHRPRAVHVTVGEEAVCADIALTGIGGLRGTVRDVQGTPVAGAGVTVTAADGEVVTSAKTGPDGGYAITDLHAGTFTVRVQAPGHRPHAQEVDTGRAGAPTHDVTLVPAAGAAGAVRHERTGRPVADARVTLLDARGQVVASTTTTADGTYTLDDLAPGVYTVVAAGFPPVSTEVALGSGGEHQLDLHVAHDADAAGGQSS